MASWACPPLRQPRRGFPALLHGRSDKARGLQIPAWARLAAAASQASPLTHLAMLWRLINGRIKGTVLDLDIDRSELAKY